MQNRLLSDNSLVNLHLSAPCDGRVSVDNVLIDAIDGANVMTYAAAAHSDTLTGVGILETAGPAATEGRVYTIDGICIYEGDLGAFRRDNRPGVLIFRTPDGASKILSR